MSNLWPLATQEVEGILDLDIVEQTNGKPAIQLTFKDGTKKTITGNIAEMVGGAGIGARKRYEDFKGKGYGN